MEIVNDRTEEAVVKGAAILSKGGIIIMPTDTVYGMAVDPGNSEAVARLYAVKQRDRGNPLARFLASAPGIETMDPILPLQVRKCAENLLPGPVTMVIENSRGETTGIRIPDHPTPRNIVSRLPFAPGVTSVNISGNPPLSSADEIKKAFGDKADLMIDAGDISGTASSVAGFLSNGISLLRKGDVSLEDVLTASSVTILFVCSGNICRSAAAEFYMKQAIMKKYRTDDLRRFGFRVRSAGTFMLEGNSPPQEITLILAEDGIDISGHTSTPLYPAMLESADVIYTMDSTHTEFIRGVAPQFLDKTEMLDPDGRDIPDPYQQSIREYRKALARIKYSVSKAVELL